MPLFLAAVCMPTASWASVNETTTIESIQQKGKTIKVVVNDAMGAVIGANVLVKGTTNGSITDSEGVANIQNVPNNATLLISYIGYQTQEVAVGKNSTVTVTLKEDSEALDEVVVVGYGTQAKKDITGSVAVVSRDALTETPVATFAEALQGKASGVYISNSGGPAGETTIRIRGVGSVNGSDPLIIVDGVQGVDISSVNPNDIDSFQVLKDASATAIYGARAANGVIIVTTKQGNKEGKVKISYNGYISASTMANNGYNMLTAMGTVKAIEKSQKNQDVIFGEHTAHTQFGDISKGGVKMPYAIWPAGASEADIVAKYGSIAAWEASYDATGTNSWARSSYYQILADGGSIADAEKGTDWLSMVKQTGITHNHELSMQGGGEKGQYAASIGYSNREGTIKGSSFERYNMRLNSTYKPTKHFSIGINTNAALMMIKGERGRQGDDNAFSKTYTMSSVVPAYNVGGDFGGSRGGLGRNTSSVTSVENGLLDWNRNFRMQTAAFAEVKDPWIKGLTLRSQFSVTLNGGWSAAMYEKTIAYDKEGRSRNYFEESANWGFGWQWTNTAQYKTHFGENHDLTVMLGTEAIKTGLGRNISANRYDYIFEKDPNTWTISNGGTATINNSGSMSSKSTMFGIFGRVDYSYAGKYLVTATIRRDASSKFAAVNRWGTFPSISLGWRISDEKFLAKAHETWLDDLKLRAGYGTTGNSNIGAYNYAFQYSNATRYLYGIEGTNTSANTGFGISNLGDSNAKWETMKMFNIGYDATLFNKLTMGFDFYIKTTSDMLVAANWTAMAGLGTKPNVNIGTMKNTGIDFQIGWRDKIGQVGYNINANISWYKNEVTKLGSSDLFTDTRINNVTITTEGQPISMFYGYVLDGLYQSEQDVLNYALPYGVGSKADLNAANWVGHYKFKDLNGDGKIDASDRQIIGNPHPDVTGGVNIGLTYKNWDLGTYLYYSLGNDLYKHYEFYTLWGQLGGGAVYSQERVDRSWDPTTKTGDLPIFIAGDTHPEAAQSHSGYVTDGSYLRMQTLTLGYTLPKNLVKKLTLSKIRLYAQLSNVFTITGYKGLDPETRSDDGYGNANDRMKGVDYGSYGMPRQYLFGVNVEF